jgi:hypothetical protein
MRNGFGRAEIDLHVVKIAAGNEGIFEGISREKVRLDDCQDAYLFLR